MTSCGGRRATHASFGVLKNPAYAGAYVYGRRRRTPIGRRSGSRQGATEAVAIQDWPVCLKDAFPGYIDWEEFMANQRRLADNLNHYDANRHGVPRQGNALLQGIAICGRCGRRLGLHYSGQNGNYPVYLCRADQHQHGGPRCQEVRALGVDAAVERLLLEALTPDRLSLAIAALGELENEARALERQWSLKRERARYEAERARRQYDAVEPENRLVARSLKRVWEDKLRQAEQIDIEYESWRRQGGPRSDYLVGRGSSQTVGCGERGRAQADPSACGERGRPGSAARERPSLDQNHLADRCRQRAQGPAQCEQLPQLRRRRDP